MLANEVSISVVSINPELLGEIEHLYSGEPYKILLWHWQFSNRFGRDSQAIIARHNGKVIGFNGTMPIQILDQTNTVIEAIWSCDFIVSSDYRGSGVGSAIKDKMLAEFQMPIMSLGISDSALPILIKKGWHSPHQLNTYQYCIRPRGIREFAFKSLSFFISRYNKLRSHSTSKKRPNISLLATLPDSTTMKKLWELHRTEATQLEVYKSLSYLHWRYVECPVAEYQFLALGNQNGGIYSLVIFRVSHSLQIEIVDFIGTAPSDFEIALLLTFFKKHFASSIGINWNTSHRLLETHLKKAGFLKKRYSTRFVAKLPGEPTKDWRLSTGDSDGDFLRAAKSQPSTLQYNRHPIASFHDYSRDGFEIRTLTENEFSDFKENWNELLERSNANKLFASWNWMFSWWQQWGNADGLELKIFSIYKDSRLVGLIPLYKKHGSFIKRYQYIGSSWSFKATVRSEYLSPIFDKRLDRELTELSSKLLQSLGFFVSFIVQDSITTNNPLKYIRLKKIDFGQRINTEGDFESYILTLGKMTRLKAFNRRKVLDASGNIVVKKYAQQIYELREFFHILNCLHIGRWGKPCFDTYATDFHINFLINNSNVTPWCSIIFENDKPISASYNVLVADTVYNIQSGFDEYYHKKISLGTLHMGQIIEDCFSDPTVSFFDLLAGNGKTTDYKRHYKGEEIQFYTHVAYNSLLLYFIDLLLYKLKSFGKILRNRAK